MLGYRGIEKRLLAKSSWYSLFYKFGLFGSDKSRLWGFSTFFVILKLLLKLQKFFHWNISIKINNFFVQLFHLLLLDSLLLFASACFFLNQNNFTFRGI